MQWLKETRSTSSLQRKRAKNEAGFGKSSSALLTYIKEHILQSKIIRGLYRKHVRGRTFGWCITSAAAFTRDTISHNFRLFKLVCLIVPFHQHGFAADRCCPAFQVLTIQGANSMTSGTMIMDLDLAWIR